METTVENRVADILQRMERLQAGNPTEKELRAFSIDLLAVRRSLDKLNDDLRKGMWFYDQFYARHAAELEKEWQERVNKWNATRQLDIFTSTPGCP